MIDDVGQSTRQDSPSPLLHHRLASLAEDPLSDNPESFKLRAILSVEIVLILIVSRAVGFILILRLRRPSWSQVPLSYLHPPQAGAAALRTKPGLRREHLPSLRQVQRPGITTVAFWIVASARALRRSRSGSNLPAESDSPVSTKVPMQLHNDVSVLPRAAPRCPVLPRAASHAAPAVLPCRTITTDGRGRGRPSP